MAIFGQAQGTARRRRDVRRLIPTRRRRLLAETDLYLAELIEEVGEPSAEEAAEADAWCDRIKRHLDKQRDSR